MFNDDTTSGSDRSDARDLQGRQRSLLSAFTLIEILIVVGIIAVLTAILLPVFMKAREASRQSACISNLKQIYAAISLYAQDNDGCLPPYQNGIRRKFGNGNVRIHFQSRASSLLTP